MGANTSKPTQRSPQGADSATPRVDRAERFFYRAGTDPQGYVSSAVARQLELELAEVLRLLHAQGIEWPPGADRAPQDRSPDPAASL